jgi:hypothetical protein
MLTILLTALIAGCQQQAMHSDYSSIHAGQTVHDVQMILGQPQELSSSQLVYHQPFRKLIVPIQDGRVSGNVEFQDYQEQQMLSTNYWVYTN